MYDKKSMPQSVRTAITACNTALVILGLVIMLLLAVGIAGARSSGTFTLFGRSYHLIQSEQMSPAIEKGDLVVVRNMPPTSFQMGDLIAYYEREGDQDYLIVRQLTGIMDATYYLADGSGNQTQVAADTTRFLGRVESRSTSLGTAVQFLQDREGRKIYLWWTVSLLFMLTGVIILLHVILKNRQPRPDEEDELEYGIRYVDAELDGLSGEEPPLEMPSADASEEMSEDVSENGFDYAAVEAAVAAAEAETFGESEPEEKASVSAPVAESVEEKFDLEKIISDIQAQLDDERK